MQFFDQYASNTVAGSNNQFFFVSDDQPHTTRTLYRVQAGGTYRYAFLFSNILDSTYGNGSQSHCNLVLDSWTLCGARVGVTAACSATDFAEPSVMQPLTFGGSAEQTVAPAAFFSSDAVELTAAAGEYICLELTYQGKVIPYHKESIIPSFVLENGVWTPTKEAPSVGMVGCDRAVDSRIGFLGDSITQGNGTQVNSYTHWNAVVAGHLGERYAYWNLGIGCGRASDAASDGAWLFKAKHNDLVIVCFGVNDLLQGSDAAAIIASLDRIVDKLQAAGVTVAVQTVPPFDYTEPQAQVWHAVNKYIKGQLAQRVAFVFDCAEYLKKSDAEPHIAPYGGHPNAAGCKIWGDALAAVLGEWLKVREKK